MRNFRRIPLKKSSEIISSKQNIEQRKEYLFLYYARLAACLAVLVIHTVGANVASFGKIPLAEWWIATLFDSSVVWAVPLFIMISGALFLDQHVVSFKTFYRKRFISVGIPTIFWILFYSVFFHVLRGDVLSASIFIKRIIFEQPYENLYFLFIILELYVLTPFLQRILISLDKREQLYLIVILLFIGIFWRYQQFIGTMFIPYLGYYVLGFYCKNITVSKEYRTIAITVFLILVGAITIGTYLFASHTLYNFKNDFFFYHHTNVLVIAITTSVFFLFSSYNDLFSQKKKTTAIIKLLASTAFGIYLIHYPVRMFLYYGILQIQKEPAAIPSVFLTIVFLFLLSVSFVITKVLQHLPVLKYII